jgi:translation initiation factor IF-1
LRHAIWEEEVERRVTSAVYDRLFRLRTADDEERDWKLHGKMKALIVVGVTLEHLGVELSDKEKETLQPAVERIGVGMIIFGLVVDGRVTTVG